MNKDPTAEKEAEVKEEAKKSGLWFQGGEGEKDVRREKPGHFRNSAVIVGIACGIGRPPPPPFVSLSTRA